MAFSFSHPESAALAKRHLNAVYNAGENDVALPKRCSFEFKSSLPRAGLQSSFDLAVSHFSISELSEEVQLRYAREVLLRAERSHLLVNYPQRCRVLRSFLSNESRSVDVRTSGFSVAEIAASQGLSAGAAHELWILKAA